MAQYKYTVYIFKVLAVDSDILKVSCIIRNIYLITYLWTGFGKVLLCLH